jgi:hypothetical protein
MTRLHRLYGVHGQSRWRESFAHVLGALDAKAQELAA